MRLEIWNPGIGISKKKVPWKDKQNTLELAFQKKKKPIEKFHEGLNLNTIYLLFNLELFHIQGFNYIRCLGPSPNGNTPPVPFHCFRHPIRYTDWTRGARKVKSPTATTHILLMLFIDRFIQNINFYSGSATCFFFSVKIRVFKTDS